MTERTNLEVIDADAHVIETEHTWDYLEASERKFLQAPILTCRRTGQGIQSDRGQDPRLLLPNLYRTIAPRVVGTLGETFGSLHCQRI